MKAKPVGIEALVVAARAAGYAMAPAEDAGLESEFGSTNPAIEPQTSDEPVQSRAVAVIVNREAASTVVQSVTTWVRDRLPAIGWRAPA